ncbi:CD44 antigen [Chanos chanos]|uniref:CD44 antigen n=1 Tax=Chanos chanos TaxID=29144 RepID=A0A6J2X0X7_CHACN|nr:CD44 antigen-like [Chanos chanos]
MMWKFLVSCIGLLAVSQAAPAEGQTGRCSYAGVFLAEGSAPSSLSFQQAMELCQSLGSSLATEEQVKIAFEKGLKTCRHGWIHGQNVTFLPHTTDPHCPSTSNEVVSHAKPSSSLHDAYCFDESGSSGLDCDSAITSGPDTSQNQPDTQGNGIPTAQPDLNEDITSPPQQNNADITEQTNTALQDLGEVQKDAQTPTELPNEDFPVEKTTEKPNYQTTEFPDTVDLEEEQYLPIITTTHSPAKDSAQTTHKSLFPELEDMSGSGSGSGSDFESEREKDKVMPRIFLEHGFTKAPPKQTQAPDNEVKHPIPAVEAPFSARTNIGQRAVPLAPEPTVAAQAQEGTPGWLIIFSFVLVVGAIVCILAAIATRDKWYGPIRKMTITSRKGDRTEKKLQPIMKEQEMVTLVRCEPKQQNGKVEDFTVISLEECPEKEHLM